GDHSWQKKHYSTCCHTKTQRVAYTVACKQADYYTDEKSKNCIIAKDPKSLLYRLGAEVEFIQPGNPVKYPVQRQRQYKPRHREAVRKGHIGKAVVFLYIFCAYISQVKIGRASCRE